MHYLSKSCITAPQTSLLHPGFLFECFYDEQDSCSCLKASQKTGKGKSVR